MGHARDLRGGQIVAEAEDEQELVGGPELHRASVEQRYELASPHLLFRVRHRVGVAVMQMIDVDILSNEIRQPAPDCAAVPRGVVAASWAAVALPVFIETETLGKGTARLSMSLPEHFTTLEPIRDDAGYQLEQRDRFTERTVCAASCRR